MITAILTILLLQVRFADIGLSRDAQHLLRAHAEAWFAKAELEEQCPRGEATRWLDGGAYKQVSPIAAVETHVLKGGANITIIQSGCEYYLASIRFVSPHKISIADALRELRRLGAKPVFDLSKAERAIRRHPNLALQTELPIPGDGTEFLQTQLIITRVGTTGDGHFVEFQLSKGPL